MKRLIQKFSLLFIIVLFSFYEPSRTDSSAFSREATYSALFDLDSAQSSSTFPLLLRPSLPPWLNQLAVTTLQAFYDPLISLLDLLDRLHSSFDLPNNPNTRSPFSSSSSSASSTFSLSSLSSSSSSSSSSSLSIQEEEAEEWHLTSRSETDSSRAAALPCSGVGVLHGIEYPLCYCPLDYLGNRCESKRPFVCQPLLVDPQPLCPPPPPPSATVQYGDPVCFPYSRQRDAPVFSYTLRCSFTNTSGMDPLPPGVALPLPYWVLSTNSSNGTDPVFAITQAPGVEDDWAMLLKVFNFNRLSDLRASSLKPLSPAQILGVETIAFPLLLASFSDEYLMGGRLFFEAGVYSNASSGPPPGMSRRLVAASFIDFTDYTPTGNPSYTAPFPGWAILLIVVAVLTVFAIALKFSVKYWHRRQKALSKKKVI